MTRVVLTAVVAIAAGFYAGYQAARDGDQAATTGAWVGVDRTVAEPVSCRATLTPADVELLKRELVSAIAHSTTGAPSLVERRTATPQPATDETIAANASLHEVLDRAVASGVWTHEDAMGMNSLMGRASPHAVNKIVRTLVAAVNAQQLRIETDGFPF
jgi:hypothetical protein